MATITPAAEMAQKRGTVCPESQDVSFRKMKDSGFEWIGEIPVEWKEYCSDFSGITTLSVFISVWVSP